MLLMTLNPHCMLNYKLEVNISQNKNQFSPQICRTRHNAMATDLGDINASKALNSLRKSFHHIQNLSSQLGRSDVTFAN